MQIKEIQNKIKQTCLERYGVENPSQNKDIQNKIKQTCLKRYGKEHFNSFGSTEFKENMIKKYRCWKSFSK